MREYNDRSGVRRKTRTYSEGHTILILTSKKILHSEVFYLK